MGNKSHAFMTIIPETRPYPVSKSRIEWRVSDGRTGSDPFTASALGALVWMLIKSGVNSIEFREENVS
jgi:hypothetical protein